MTASKIEFNAAPDQKAFVLEAKKMDIDAGLLGKVFGTSRNAPTNIGGLLLVLLVTSGIFTLFYQSNVPPGDYWKTITPILTLIMGYLFGKHQKES